MVPRKNTSYEVFFLTHLLSRITFGATRSVIIISMLKPIVWLFLILATSFAILHVVAVRAALYWYYPWFDVIMHLYGGALIALGIFALCTFRSIRIKPSLTLLLSVLALFVLSWEIFEYAVGLYNPATYLYDVSKDLLSGLIGGLLGYALISKIRR